MKLRKNIKPSFSPRKRKPSFKEILEWVLLGFNLIKGIEWFINYINDKLF